MSGGNFSVFLCRYMQVFILLRRAKYIQPQICLRVQTRRKLFFTYILYGKGSMVTIAGHLGCQDSSGPLFLNTRSANCAYVARGVTWIWRTDRNIVSGLKPHDLQHMAHLVRVA